jgi:hypothetical protein
MLKYIYIILAVSLASCETVMDDIDLGETPDLATVEGLLTDSAMQHSVRLTRTRDYFSEEAYPVISNATVTITDLTTGQVLSTLTEDENEPGLYLTTPDVKGIIGHAYQLDVETEDASYRAIDTLFPVSNLDEVYVDPFDFNKEWNALYIDSYDPPEVNYYTWRIYFNGVLFDDYANVPFADDVFLADTIRHIMLYFDDLEGSNPRDFLTTPDSVEIKVQQMSMSKDAFIFHQTIYSLLNKGSMFDSPMANVVSNFYKLDNKGDESESQTGLFMTSAMSEKTILYEK